MKNWKDKNLVEVLGGMAALVGLFLPYASTRDISFFQSLYSPEYGLFAPCLMLGIVLTTVLYALEVPAIPEGFSLALFLICLAFPGHACVTMGFTLILPQLRAGAWSLLGGLLVMSVYPLFPREGKEYFGP